MMSLFNLSAVNIYKIIEQYFINIIFLFSFFIIIFVVNFLILTKLKKRSEKPGSRINKFFIDIARKNIIPLIFFSGIFIFLKELQFSEKAFFITQIFFTVIISFYIIRFVTAVFKYFFEHYWFAREKNIDKINSYKGIIPAFNIIIWLIGSIFILDNLGVNISTLLAGLGIGGIAVALASQTILADLFSYFSMIFDRPFEIGDFISIDDFMGTIEHIGVKTTRINSLSGEEIIFSNKDLTGSRVRNFKRMDKRRAVFSIGVVYETKIEIIKKIPEFIKEVIISIENTKFDRANFFSFGESGLIFESVYFVLTPDYNKYMDIQEKINFGIMEKFEKENIEFSYPTHKIIIEK